VIAPTGTRISVYERLRASLASSGQQEPALHHTGVGTALLLGLTAGAVGQAVAVPADLIKVRDCCVCAGCRVGVHAYAWQ
jgi:solute carrier family 25 uncoupling protein 27